MGGTGGGGTKGGRGLGDTGSLRGGGAGLAGLDSGCITSLGGVTSMSAMGDTGSTGLSVSRDTHRCEGSPDVPGGQVQTGRWAVILQSASSPQMPSLHTS